MLFIYFSIKDQSIQDFNLNNIFKLSSINSLIIYETHFIYNKKFNTKSKYISIFIHKTKINFILTFNPNFGSIGSM